MLRLSALALILHPAFAFAAVSFTNGSFELPVADGSTFNAPSSFSGWAVTAGSAEILKSSPTYIPAAGSQLIFIPGMATQTANITQTLSGFVPGIEYEISYALCGRNSQATAKDFDVEIALFNNKQDSFTFPVSAMETIVGSSTNPWQRRAFRFFAKEASSLLDVQVYRSNALTDAYATFDDFSVRVVPKGAPNVALAGKRPRKPVTKSVYVLRGSCAATLPLDSVTVTAGRKILSLGPTGAWSAKIRLKHGRNRITVEAADIAGTKSAPVRRVVKRA